MNESQPESGMPRSLIDVSLVEAREEKLLASYAMHSKDSQGRRHAEATHFIRGPFQRDRDRVLHSAAFRRLSGKTQVFTGHGDYHRTRLTHTMEVSSIARTIGRALHLNEDLIEALALLHDIGHPPFGHAGEEALDEVLKVDGGSFSHNQFALTIVEELEQRYPGRSGLNLTREVLAGQGLRIDKSSIETPLLEVQVVDLADSITYDAHDVDDGVELGWLTMDQLREVPIISACEQSVLQRYGSLDGPELRRAIVHELINLQVAHLIHESEMRLSQVGDISAAEICRTGFRLKTPSLLADEKRQLEAFLFERLYRHSELMKGRTRAQAQIKELVNFYVERPNTLPDQFRSRVQNHGVKAAAVECIAAMTDHSFLETFHEFAR